MSMRMRVNIWFIRSALGTPRACAAPEGGARPRVWGCAFLLAAFLLVTPPLGAQEAPQVLPSGLGVTLFDVIDESPTWRVRYLAPGLAAAGLDAVDLAEDMQVLCETHAVPSLRGQGVQAGRIVLSLMGKPVEFGVMTPGVAQVFESFSVQDGLCIWEAF